MNRLYNKKPSNCSQVINDLHQMMNFKTHVTNTI